MKGKTPIQEMRSGSEQSQYRHQGDVCVLQVNYATGDLETGLRPSFYAGKTPPFHALPRPL